MDEQLIEEVLEGRKAALDEARPSAVASTHAANRLTARERIAAFCDTGSFVEYGVLAQDELDGEPTPADGLVGGTGQVAGRSVVVASYDVSVARGTQGKVNQAKLERLVALAVDHAWPFVCFADGEGARQQRADYGSRPWVGSSTGRIGLFDGLCELSGLVPTVAIISGTSLDEHVAIAMFAECVIATKGSYVGSTDGTLIPVEERAEAGDVDVLADDEPGAIEAARTYLAYMLLDEDEGNPSEALQTIDTIVPAKRRRPYDMRKVITALADRDSVLELRPEWGSSLITSLVRMNGRSVGIFANQPMSHLLGAIDAEAADKMARFVELCDAHGIPLVSLIDSPGFYIGQEAERGGIARHHVRTLSAIEHRDVPLYCVQIRKAYGLGPLVMRGSWGHLPPDLRIAWPSVETGGMSLEGAAYLAKRKEIQAAKTPEEARAIRDDYAETLRKRESGIRAGQNFSFDDIVHPAETRDGIIAMLELTSGTRRTEKKTYLDAV